MRYLLLAFLMFTAPAFGQVFIPGNQGPIIYSQPIPEGPVYYRSPDGSHGQFYPSDENGSGTWNRWSKDGFHTGGSTVGPSGYSYYELGPRGQNRMAIQPWAMQPSVPFGRAGQFERR